MKRQAGNMHYFLKMQTVGDVLVVRERVEVFCSRAPQAEQTAPARSWTEFIEVFWCEGMYATAVRGAGRVGVVPRCK